jgi:hypothetical protein
MPSGIARQQYPSWLAHLAALRNLPFSLRPAVMLGSRAALLAALAVGME